LPAAAAATKTDPAELRELRAAVAARDVLIKQLKRGLEDAMKVVAQIEAKGFEKTGVEPELVRKAVEAATDQIVRIVEQTMGRRQQEMLRLKKEAAELLGRLQKLLAEDVSVSVAVRHNEPFTLAPAARARAADRPVLAVGDGETSGKSSVERMLAVLAQAPAEGLSDRKLAARAGVSRKKSTFRNAMTDLRKSGYITDRDDRRVLTDAGRDKASTVPALPSGKNLLDHYRREIGECAARQIFEILIEAAGKPMTADELAGAAGIDIAKSTFRNAMTDLRTWDIVDGKKELKLSDELLEALNG
jgi:ribosomal protein S19E (S16A)